MVDLWRVAGFMSGIGITAMTVHALLRYKENEPIPGSFSIMIPMATGMMFLAPHQQRAATLKYWR